MNCSKINVLVAVAFFIILLIFHAYPTVYSEAGAHEDFSRIYNNYSPPLVFISNSNLDSLSIIFNCKDIISDVINVEGDEYTRFRINDCGVTTEVGYPELPFIIKYIAIPKCENIDVNINVFEDTTLDDINVYPAPSLIEERNSQNEFIAHREIFIKNKDFYASHDLYPKDCVFIHDIFMIRKQRVAELHIFPLQYNPASKTVRYIKDAEINILNNSPVAPICISTGPFERICKDILINYEDNLVYQNSTNQSLFFGSGAGSVDTTCNSLSDAIANNTDYLIIAGSDLWANDTSRTYITKLAEKRAEFNGFNVSVIDINDIIGEDAVKNNNSDTLKYELVEFYNNNHAGHMQDSLLGYILLVGDAFNCGDVYCSESLRKTIIPVKSTNEPSDMYFAGLDDQNDNSPDVFIGRICVDDSLEAKSFLKKIINYEPHDAYGNWQKNVLFVGGQWAGMHEMADECELITPPSYTFSEIQRDQYDSYSDCSSAIVDTIDNGVLFVSYGGHGQQYYWSNTFYPKYYEILDNFNKYPVIYAGACETARFDIPYNPSVHPNDSRPESNIYYSPAAPSLVDSLDCMAERMTNIDSLGAVAYIGYTRVTSGEVIDKIPEFFNRFFAGQCIGEFTTYMYYSLTSTDKYLLALIGDPALDPFYEEFYDDPSDSIDICIEPDSILFNKLIFDTNSPNTLSVVIKNTGVRDACNFSILLEQDSDSLTSVIVDTLKAYHRKVIDFEVNISQIGKHIMTFTVNPDYFIKEFNYINNQADTCVIALGIKQGFPYDIYDCYSIFDPAQMSLYHYDNQESKVILINESGAGIRLLDSDGSSLADEEILYLHPSYIPSLGSISNIQSKELLVANRGIDNITLSLYNALNFNLIESTVFNATFSLNSFEETCLYDIDDDGDCEAIYFERISYPYNTHKGVIQIYDYSNNEFVDVDSDSLHYRPIDVAIEDLDYDNRKEIAILGFRGTHSIDPYNWYLDTLYISIYDYDSELTLKRSFWTSIDSLNTSTYAYADSVKGKIVISDIDLDNYQDLIACLNDEIVIIRGNDLENGDILSKRFSTNKCSRTKLCVVDLYGDINKEIIMTNNRKIRIIYYQDGDLIVADSLNIDGAYEIIMGPFITDIDNDDDADIIWAEKYVGDVSEDHIKIRICDSDFADKEPWQDIMLFGVNKGSMGIDDIDADNKQDIILQTDKEIYVFNIPWASSGDAYCTIENINLRNNNCLKRYIRGEYENDLSMLGNIEAIGDITVASSKTLCITPGCNIGIRDCDMEYSGSDTSRIEMICNGTIEAHGTNMEPICIHSLSSNPGNEDWVGLLCSGSSTENYLRYCTIRHAETAIKSYAPIELDNCIIDSTNTVSFNLHCNVIIDSSTIYFMRDNQTWGDDTLTVTGNSAFWFSPDEIENYLADTTRIEYFVWGRLYVDGDESDNVIFKSFAESPGADDWYGIRFHGNDCSGYIHNCDIADAYYGLRSHKTITMENCTISNCYPCGLYLFSSGGSTNNSYISHCDIIGNDADDASGIRIWNCFDSITVDSSNISKNYRGIWLSNTDACIKNTEIDSNTTDGIWVTYYQCLLETYPTIDYCRLNGNGENGIYFDFTSGEVSNSKIWGVSHHGIYCSGIYSHPEVHHSKIFSHKIGVKAYMDASPILGDVSQGKGMNNSIYDNTLYEVYQYGLFQTTVMAENCWWGTSQGQPPSMLQFYGSVDYNPYLEYDPVYYLYPRTRGRSNEIWLARNYPNPCGQSGTTISYFIPAGREAVSLIIYDVLGRRIKTLANTVQGPGEYQIRWDGRNDNGVLVAPGVYFYKFSVGNRSITKKLVFFR